mgnify:FL=1|jgi:hypothetical protein
MKFNCPKVSFNSIANILASVSAVGLAGIIGTASYVYVNRDAIIDDIKKEAIESITGGALGGFSGGALTGDVLDTNPLAGENAAAGGTSMGLPIPGSPF